MTVDCHRKGGAMSHYYTFSPEDAVAYARQYGGVFDPESLVSADEIGDGNLNLVFKIRDRQEVSRVIVKQALPYVRCVGESWPLTLDRARIEAETLLAHQSVCPQHTVHVRHYDPVLAVMVQEDLSDHAIWRKLLISGESSPVVAAQIGEYLAQTLFHYSDFYQSPHEKKKAVGQFLNPELCQITEDLFFTDPYSDHPRNQFESGLAADVAALRHDRPLLQAVAALKHIFLTRAEALLHGDLHSGSIFVTQTSMKVIDAEFGFYGPMGFDVGTVIANLLLNICGLNGLLGQDRAGAVRKQRLQDIADVWQVFASRFTSLHAHYCRDAALASADYVEQFLHQVWHDTLGFCGTELIRRTVGLAHVADLDSIENADQRLHASEQALRLGRTLIVDAPNVHDLAALIMHVRSVVEEPAM